LRCSKPGGRKLRGNYVAGIDVGAVYTKAVLLNGDGEVVGMELRPTTMNPSILSRELFSSLIKRCGVGGGEVGEVVATGEGRKAVQFATYVRTDITSFAKGAHHLYPTASLLVDIGGQGIRVMRVDEEGVIMDFKTNDKCSSGTGCFFDTISYALQIPLNEMGSLSLQARNSAKISSTCTIFAESEVVSLMAKGRSKEEILAGINRMVSRRIVALINSLRADGEVFLGGGVAENRGVVKAIEEALGREVVVPDHPIYTSAIGAALFPLSKPAPAKRKEREGREKLSFFRVLLKGVVG